jgi:hypothetical protein
MHNMCYKLFFRHKTFQRGTAVKAQYEIITPQHQMPRGLHQKRTSVLKKRSLIFLFLDQLFILSQYQYKIKIYFQEDGK